MNPCPVWIRIDDFPEACFEELKRHVDGADFRKGRDEELDRDWLSKVEVVFTDTRLPDTLIQRLTHLKWVQFTRGGVPSLMTPALQESPALVSGTQGIHGIQITEFAMGCILTLAKRFPQFNQSQRERVWNPVEPLEIAGMTLGILGLGVIGSEIARKAKAFDMHILGIKRTLTPKPDFVDELWTTNRLRDFLSESDFVVVCVSENPETRGLLGLQELRNMKETAYLVNLTNGDAIQEDPLVWALREGWIAGAILDALPRSPLPPDSPPLGSSQCDNNTSHCSS